MFDAPLIKTSTHRHPGVNKHKLEHINMEATQLVQVSARTHVDRNSALLTTDRTVCATTLSLEQGYTSLLPFRIHGSCFLAMASAEAVLSSDPQRICPCGSSRCESVNDTVACCDCGRVLEDDFLVNYGCLASTGVGSIDNIVPEGCTGAHLTGASSLNRGRRAKVRRLQTQVSNHGRDLELSETAISKARDLIEDARTMDTTAETAVAAAALVLGARIEGFPVSMKTVCLRLEIPFSDFKASIASLQRRMQQPVPSVQVCGFLLCPNCTGSREGNRFNFLLVLKVGMVVYNSRLPVR